MNQFVDSQITSEQLLHKIINGKWQEVLNYLCRINDNIVIINHKIFKHFATNETYPIISNYVINHLDNILTKHNSFRVYINMKELTMRDIDKHKKYIIDVSKFLQEKYPNKLEKCEIINAPSIFKCLYNIVSILLDSDTKKKIAILYTQK